MKDLVSTKRKGEERVRFHFLSHFHRSCLTIIEGLVQGVITQGYRVFIGHDEQVCHTNTALWVAATEVEGYRMVS